MLRKLFNSDLPEWNLWLRLPKIISFFLFGSMLSLYEKFKTCKNHEWIKTGGQKNNTSSTLHLICRQCNKTHCFFYKK